MEQFLDTYWFSDHLTAPLALAQSVFPKFVSRLGSHAYRMHGDKPGSGMLLFNGNYTEPNCDIRALAMGFPQDYHTHPNVKMIDRHRLLGSCIDGNICRWLVDALCSPTPVPTAYLTSTPRPPAAWNILLDSGASSHMWGDLTEFDSYSPFSTGPLLVSGLKALAYGTGTVRVRLMAHGGKNLSATLHDVLYVPDLQDQPGGPVRLFSSSAFIRRSGGSVTLGTHNSRLQLTDGTTVTVRPEGPLYFVDGLPGFLPGTPNPVAFPAKAGSTAPQDRALWHARLGHLNYQAVDSLQKTHGLKLCGPHSPFCSTCALIKRKTTAISRTLHERPTVPFSFMGLDF